MNKKSEIFTITKEKNVSKNNKRAVTALTDKEALKFIEKIRELREKNSLSLESEKENQYYLN